MAKWQLGVTKESEQALFAAFTVARGSLLGKR